MPHPITVLTVDDHPLLREGIAAVLEDEPDIRLVAEAASGCEAIDRYRTHRPSVTLMDIHREFPDARIIVVTTSSGDVLAVRAIRAGACGYLLKNMLRKDLPETIRTVHSGRRHTPREIAVAIAEHVTDGHLAEREIDVLRCAANGNANKQIAAQLSIAEETVKTHMKRILSRLTANDRTHAVTIAMRRGIISL